MGEERWVVDIVTTTQLTGSTDKAPPEPIIRFTDMELGRTLDVPLELVLQIVDIISTLGEEEESEPEPEPELLVTATPASPSRLVVRASPNAQV